MGALGTASSNTLLVPEAEYATPILEAVVRFKQTQKKYPRLTAFNARMIVRGKIREVSTKLWPLRSRSKVDPKVPLTTTPFQFFGELLAIVHLQSAGAIGAPLISLMQ